MLIGRVKRKLDKRFPPDLLEGLFACQGNGGGVGVVEGLFLHAGQIEFRCHAERVEQHADHRDQRKSQNECAQGMKADRIRTSLPPDSRPGILLPKAA